MDLSEFDVEPDYVFVVKKYGAPFLIGELISLNLIVKEFQSKPSNTNPVQAPRTKTL